MIGIFMLLAATVSADAPMAPSGKWKVDYQRSMCLLSREFGPNGAVTFAFKPAVQMDGGGAILYLLTPNQGGTAIRRGTVTVTLNPSGRSTTLRYVSAIAAPLPARGYEFGADADFMAALRQSTDLTIDVGGRSFALSPDSLDTAIKALDACNRDLFRSWGIPDASTIAELPKGTDPALWFTEKDYPKAAAVRGAHGRVVAVLTLAPDGAASGCRIAVSSGDPDLDEATCRLARKRGHYMAASRSGDRHSVLSVQWILNEG